MKTRIIKRTTLDEVVKYVIQQKNVLFRWIWVDANRNYGNGILINQHIYVEDSYDTLKEAQKNLCYFNGTKCIEEIL